MFDENGRRDTTSKEMSWERQVEKVKAEQKSDCKQ